MKFVVPSSSIIVILVFLTRAIRPGAASGKPASIYEVNESSSCNERSTAMYSTIVPTACPASMQCSEESGADGSNTLHSFCEYDQEDYLKYAYGDTTYALFEHYEGSDCDKLTSTDVFRADGKCHNSLNYALQVVVDSDGTVDIKSRSKTCEVGDWKAFADPIPKEKVNTGVCIDMETHSAKLYLVDGTNAASRSSSASGSGTNVTILAGDFSSSISTFSTMSTAPILMVSTLVNSLAAF
ncbi:hypothetical protein PHMEG_0007322 [Phytophthora megakarya]|uniref:TKL protein kinase n=1 Tax=Phytophthora megakarya TaxID=4795 RepID=A0A225WLL4_9STRA|nr:hypothetical protein PHMEG_0007322 [Phytophthora megakarya]